jgi:predicted alpha/beta hydrolase
VSERHDQLEARTADGVTLRIDHVPARGDRRGAVLCLHAMMTDGRYFGARREGTFAAALAEAGLDVYVADFRGHGQSVPPRAGNGDWSFDDLALHDLPALVTAVSTHAGLGPTELAILGHSLGGLVACAALGTQRIVSPRVLVLVATSVWLGETPGRRALMRVYRGVTALLGRAPIRALRVGTADESRTYVEQLTGWAKNGRWESRSGVDYLARLATITTPTLAFAGATDWMCPPFDAETIATRIPTCSPVRVVGTELGDPLDPDHFELFTRPELTALRGELANALITAA